MNDTTEAFFSKWRRWLVGAALAAFLLAVVAFLSDILFPFVLACFLAYVFAPVVARVHRWKVRGRRVPKGVAVLGLYVLILGSLGGGGFYLVPNMTRELAVMVRQLPSAIEHVNQVWLPPINDRLNQLAQLLPHAPHLDEDGEPPIEATEAARRAAAKAAPADTLGHALERYAYEIRPLEGGGWRVTAKPRRAEAAAPKAKAVDLQDLLNENLSRAGEVVEKNLINLVGFGRQILAVAAGSVWTLFITLMVTAFILVDVGRVDRFARSLLPERRHAGYEAFLVRLDVGLNGVVRGQLMICLVNGFLTMVGLLIFEVPFVVTLTILATLASLIPIFGTFLSSAPILIMALTVSFPTALLMLAWILGIHFIEGNFLNPKIIGTAAEIHPALVVFALIAGEHVAGIAGALLAVPIFSILQNTLFHFKANA